MSRPLGDAGVGDAKAYIFGGSTMVLQEAATESQPDAATTVQIEVCEHVACVLDLLDSKKRWKPGR